MFQSQKYANQQRKGPSIIWAFESLILMFIKNLNACISYAHFFDDHKISFVLVNYPQRSESPARSERVKLAEYDERQKRSIILR